MTDKKRIIAKPRIFGAPYGAGKDLYQEFAYAAWHDPADDGPEVEIIRREHLIAWEEHNVQPRG